MVRIRRTRLFQLASFLLCGGLLVPCAARSEEHRFILQSASSSTRLETFDLQEYVASEIASKWRVVKSPLRGGMQEGVSLITIDNGKLQVQVVSTRGMSILNAIDVESGERVFGWDSPVKEVVNPSYIDLEGRGGLGWLQGFNEWMVRCGLEFAGHPGQDKFTTNTGGEAEMALTLHGKIGNIPASDVELIIEKQAPYRLRLRGVVNEVMFNGPRLRLTSELSMLPGTRTIELHESVENVGATRQEYQIIYHTNFGAPLLEDGARVVVAAESVAPMNDKAAAGIDDFNVYGPPTAGYVEEVFLVTPKVDASGATAAVLHDAQQSRGAMMKWKADSLPFLTLWKNTAAVEDGYVTGIEPGTGFPFNRRIERHFGRVPSLDPGESDSFDLEFVYLPDRNAVSAAVAKIGEIKGETKPVIESSPPALPDFASP